jgi:Aspartyl protease
MRLGRVPGVVGATVVIAALLGACGTTRGVPGSQIRVSPPACASTTGTPPVPLTVVRPGGGPVLLAPVCVDGRGPYPFVLDTGAGASLVTPQLVRALHLHGAGSTPQAVGIGCTAARRRVYVDSWAVGEVPLSGQPVLTAAIPGFGFSQQPAGLLGSDVLSRFGAIRIDYMARTLTVLAPEASPPSHASVLSAQATQPPPPLLVHGDPEAVAPLTVVKFSGTALATAQVVFGNQLYPFAVDTASTESSISPSLARVLHLTSTHGPVQAPSVACRGTVGQVGSGSWGIGTQNLESQPLAMAAPARGTQAGVMGTLGSDVLSRYGSIVVDYRTALLWLGAH